MFLSITPSRRCTDPKDYVYAVLGMCHQHELKPDYDLTASEFMAQILLGISLDDPLSTGFRIHRLLNVKTRDFRKLCRSDASLSSRRWLCNLVMWKGFYLKWRDNKYLYFESDADSNYFITSANIYGDPTHTYFDPMRIYIDRIEGTSIGLVRRKLYDKDLNQTLSWEVVAVGFFPAKIDLDSMQIGKQTRVVLSHKGRQPDEYTNFFDIRLMFAGTTIEFRKRRNDDNASYSPIRARVSMDVFAFLLGTSWLSVLTSFVPVEMHEICYQVTT